jgi:hypothetical protein
MVKSLLIGEKSKDFGGREMMSRLQKIYHGSTQIRSGASNLSRFLTFCAFVFVVVEGYRKLAF